MSQRDIFVVGAVRMAIGGFGGALKEVALSDLATNVLRELIARSGAPAEDIGHVVMGNVIPTAGGSTGAIISTKAIYELHRTDKRYAPATMCRWRARHRGDIRARVSTRA